MGWRRWLCSGCVHASAAGPVVPARSRHMPIFLAGLAQQHVRVVQDGGAQVVAVHANALRARHISRRLLPWQVLRTNRVEGCDTRDSHPLGVFVAVGPLV